VIQCLRHSLQGAKTVHYLGKAEFSFLQDSNLFVPGRVAGKSPHCVQWRHRKQRATRTAWGHPEARHGNAGFEGLDGIEWDLFPGNMMCCRKTDSCPLPREEQQCAYQWLFCLGKRCTCFRGVGWYTSMELQDYYLLPSRMHSSFPAEYLCF